MSYGTQDQDREAAIRAARDRAPLPGVFLLVVGVLNLILGLGSLAIGARLTNLTAEERQKIKQQALEGVSPEQRKELEAQGQKLEDLMEQMLDQTPGYFKGAGVAILVAALFTLIGGICMIRLRGYGLAVTGSVLACVPFLSPLSCPLILGLGVGLWALIVLFNQDVQAGFRANASAPVEPSA